MQDLALSMRREGKPYKRPPTKRRKTGKALEAVTSNVGKNVQEEETGSRPSSPVQVDISVDSPFSMLCIGKFEFGKETSLDEQYL